MGFMYFCVKVLILNGTVVDVIQMKLTDVLSVLILRDQNIL